MKNINEMKATDTISFIEKANHIHKNKYDYSLVNYINSKTKVKIICKNHGVFEQSPSKHILKRGCPKCKFEAFGLRRVNEAKERRSLIKIKQPSEYKIIPLTRGKSTLVDNEDYNDLSRFNWRINAHGYAKNDKVGLMHRYLLSVPKNKVVDHINGNPLDNRRINIRICEQSENARNQKIKKSKYKGIYFDKRSNKWISRITLNYKGIHLGSFNTKEEAALAYDKAAIKYHGEFSNLNFKNNRFESGTVKEIDHSTCQDKEPIQTLAAIRDRLLPLVDNTSECGDMLSCTGSRTECVQGLVDHIVDQYSTLKNQNELMENAIRIFCERVEKGEVRSHKTYTNFKGILHSIKKGSSDES